MSHLMGATSWSLLGKPYDLSPFKVVSVYICNYICICTSCIIMLNPNMHWFISMVHA